jgi:DNA-binding NarL/FixJ family response regulator
MNSSGTARWTRATFSTTGGLESALAKRSHRKQRPRLHRAGSAHASRVNGFETQTRMAASDISGPVIIITSHDSDETRNRALDEMPVAYLRKPVDDQALLDAIELALSHKLQR